MTLASIAVFMRDALMELWSSGKIVDVPHWLRRLIDIGWVQIPAGANHLPISSILIERDAIVFALPVAAGLPGVLLYLALAGAVAAALCAAATSVVTLGNILAEDIINGLSWEPPANRFRLVIARIGLVVTGLCGGAIALAAPADPLSLLLWALVLSASAGFPVLVLSIWWKRINSWGAMAGMGTGFIVAVLTILACESEVIGANSVLAAAIALPCGLVIAMLASVLTPRPGRPMLEIARDLRIPGGETILDREMRLLRLKQRQRS